MYRKNIIVIIILIFGATAAWAAPSGTSDSLTAEKKGIVKKFLEYLENSNKTDPEKKFDFSIIGGPHYSNEKKVGLGMVASGLYRVDRSDLEMSPSNISLYGDISTTGAYLIGISGNTLFPGLRYRIDADARFAYTPDKYWGTGYQAGRNNAYSKYDYQQIALKLDFLKRMAPDVYFGITTHVNRTEGKKFEDISLLGAERARITAVGVGAIFSYDSRDFIPNPYRGVYLKAEFIAYPEFLGSTFSYNRTELIARYYQHVWKGGILAFDLQGVFNNGDVAWNMMALAGGSYQMRGYYKGRYRDRNLMQSQVELRQNLYRRSGAVIWVGGGNVFPDFSAFTWKHTLPTTGVGYRWEFKNRVNVRLDYGIGKGESAFYFNINESF